MKKSSLMGASVVAAALLAAAPVVAPVASLATPATQEVKAASTATKEVAKKITDMSSVTTLKNDRAANVYGNFRNFSEALVAIPDVAGYIETRHRFGDADAQPFTINAANSALEFNNAFPTGVEGRPIRNLLRYFFNGQNQVNLVTTDNVTAARSMSYTLQFKYSNAINHESYVIRSAQDAGQVQRDLANNGGTVTMSMQLYDGEGDSLENAGLLESTVSYNVNNVRAAYVNYDDTLNAHVGDSANLYNLSNSFMNANGKIRDYNGNDITTDAYNRGVINVSTLHDANGHTAPQSGAAVNGNFTRAGQFYQRVTINLRTLFGNQVANWGAEQWRDAVNGGLITVNGQTPSLTNADANVFLTTRTGNTIVDGVNYTAGTLVLKRTVNVGSANLATKDEKVNGVVTVNTSYITTAPLYDEAGNVIVDRSLPNKSRWQTDIKRTVYANGQVFYRVSTHEYIRADQVTFTANDASNSSDSTIKGDVVVTPSEGVFTMDNLGALLWSKSDDNNSMTVIADRYLPAKSAWRADKKAVVNGNTFYRVSTNEWVKADKGTFVAK